MLIITKEDKRQDPIKAKYLFINLHIFASLCHHQLGFASSFVILGLWFSDWVVVVVSWVFEGRSRRT